AGGNTAGRRADAIAGTGGDGGNGGNGGLLSG
ncbi:hypothetical protein LDE55_18520, partial [Mycobacterium tuberculosis]